MYNLLTKDTPETNSLFSSFLRKTFLYHCIPVDFSAIREIFDDSGCVFLKEEINKSLAGEQTGITKTSFFCHMTFTSCASFPRLPKRH